MQGFTTKAQFPPVFPFDSYFLNNFVEFIYYEGLFPPHEIGRMNTYWDAEMSEKAKIESAEEYDEGFCKSSVIGLSRKGWSKIH